MEQTQCDTFWLSLRHQLERYGNVVGWQRGGKTRGTGRFCESQILTTVRAPRVKRLMVNCFVQPVISSFRESEHCKKVELCGFEGVNSKKQQRQWPTRAYQKRSGAQTERFGVESACPSMLSEIFGRFGDFENFVNVIGKDCGEMRSWVPGHVGAEGDFTNILGIFSVPDLWHAAARPVWREREEKIRRKRERRTKLTRFFA